MPGGRSLGCKTCKQRKIKCDERLPTCWQCEKAGRYCTGALPPFVYEAEMAKAELSGINQPKSKSPRRHIRWRPVIEAKSRSQAKSKERQPRRSESSESDFLSPTACAVDLMPKQNLAARVAHVLDSTKGTGQDFIILGEWLPELTCRIGSSHALDTAVEALLVSHQGLTDRQHRDDTEQTQVYVRALNALKDDISTMSESISAETMCAAMALCNVEFLSDRDVEKPAWLSHAGGAAALFQACGPSRFKTRLEKSLLYFQAPQYVASCLMTGNDCFLDTPEWCFLLEEECEDLEPWDRLHAKVAAVYAALPGLIRDVNGYDLSNIDLERVLIRTWNLRRRVLLLEPLVQVILNDPDKMKEVASDYTDSPYQTCYRYESLLVGQPLWIYWRMIIIINSMIQRLTSIASDSVFTSADLDSSSLDAAHHIAMSAEDGRRWTPVASMLQLFNLPAAIWALSNCGPREPSNARETQWLSLLWYEYMGLTDKMMKALIANYLDAVGIAYPDATVLTATALEGLTTSDTPWETPWETLKVDSPFEIGCGA